MSQLDAARAALRDLAPSRRSWLRTRVPPFILFAAVLVVLPHVFGSRTALSLFNAIGINIVFALSFNMLLGQSGMLSFGHAVYFGLGGYTAMHAMNWIEQASLGGGPWAGFPVFALPLVGFAGGLVAGAVIGWPSCRRAGIPFAMISLGIAELVAAAGFMFVSVFGGEEGITGDRMYGIEAFGLSLGPVGEVYWFIAFWTLVGTVGMYAFTRTPLGRMAQAVRDNPQRAEFVGYDPQHVRYMVFMAAGAFAGMAGGMAAVNYEIFTPEALSLIPSGLVLLMAYIGGARYFHGPILGAVLLTYMQSNLSDFSEAWLLYLGLLFIAIVMAAPSGLAGMLDGAWRAARQPDAVRRTGRWLAMLTAGLAAIAGLVVLVEINLRRSGGLGEVFDPFGLVLPVDSAISWVAGLGLLSGGVLAIYVTRKTDPEAQS